MDIYFPLHTSSESFFKTSTLSIPRQEVDLNEMPKERRYRHSITNYPI